MNKKSCALLVALLYPISTYTSQHSQRQRRTNHTLGIHEFNHQVALKNKNIDAIRQAEQAIPTQPQSYENLKLLYAQLLQSPVSTDAEIKRWKQYRDLHQQRNAIMKQIHMPEHHASSHSVSPANLLNIKILLNLWKKLRNTYPPGSRHYRTFHEKVSILENAAKDEEFELDLIEFEKTVQPHLNTQGEITGNNVMSLNNYAKRLFKFKSNAVLQASPGMKQLAKRITQKEWQKRAQQKKAISQPEEPRRSISPEEHAQHKIRTSIAVITAQRNIVPLLRATALHRLYNELASCSSNEQKELALHAAQFHDIYKQRALLEEKLNLIIQSDNVEILKLAQTTAQELRNTYPAFHSSYAQYDQKTQLLKLKIAYIERNDQVLYDLKQLSSDLLIINCADRLLYRLFFEKMLSKGIKNKKPYGYIRDATVSLLSTYDKKEKGFDHYLTKIVRSDLKQNMATAYKNDELSTENRYTNLLILSKQLIETYPEQHPEHSKYVSLHASLECLKKINFYKNFILNIKKNNKLDRTAAYGLKHAYAQIRPHCDKLTKLKDASFVEIQTQELGNLAEKHAFYTHAAQKFDLEATLSKTEKEDPTNHELLKKTLNKLIDLPILSNQERAEFTTKSKYHHDLILQKQYTNELEKLEDTTSINYEQCIELIKKLRNLSTLTLEQILLFEDKMCKYRIQLNN